MAGAASAAHVPATHSNGPPSTAHTRSERQDEVHSRGWRRVVRHTSPQLFTITMGSGITAILLNQFPYPARWLFWLAVVTFCLHILLVSLFTLASILRYTLYPDLFHATLTHRTESLFLGAIPVSLLSFSNLIATLCAPSWGPWAAYTAWGLWMGASLLALALAAHIPLQHFPPSSAQRTPVTLHAVTPTHCLPAIAAIVAANTAAPIANALPTSPAGAQHATATILAGYILWGVGLPTSLLILGLYFARLMLAGRLPRAQIVAALITIGPLNMGASGAMQLGDAARVRFAATRTLDGGAPAAGVGDALYAAGVLLGLVLWAWALVWLWWATGNIARELCEVSRLRYRRWQQRRRELQHNIDNGNGNGNSSKSGLEFNMTYWSAIFPLGTMGLSSGRLGVEVPSAFFRVVGAIVSTLVFVLFLAVAALTLWDLCKTGGRGVFVSAAAEDAERKKRGDGAGGGAGTGSGDEDENEGEGDGDGEARTLTNEDSREVLGRRGGSGDRGGGGGGGDGDGDGDAERQKDV